MFCVQVNVLRRTGKEKRKKNDNYVHEGEIFQTSNFSGVSNNQHLNSLVFTPAKLSSPSTWNNTFTPSQKLIRSSFAAGCCFFGSWLPSEELTPFLPNIISSRSSIMSSWLPAWTRPREAAGFLIKESSFP